MARFSAFGILSVLVAGLLLVLFGRSKKSDRCEAVGFGCRFKCSECVGVHDREVAAVVFGYRVFDLCSPDMRAMMVLRCFCVKDIC